MPLRRLLYALTIFAFFAVPAHADMGIPMLMFVWPCSWILLFPVVAVESLMAVRFLKVSWKEAIRLASLSNLFSTLLGIPITWGLCLIVEMTVGIPLATKLATITPHSEIPSSVCSLHRRGSILVFPNG